MILFDKKNKVNSLNLKNKKKRSSNFKLDMLNKEKFKLNLKKTLFTIHFKNSTDIFFIWKMEIVIWKIEKLNCFFFNVYS